MKREAGDFIEDIIDAITKAANFIEGMNYDGFIKDDKTIFAVVRALEVVGEAVKSIPEGLRKKYPEIPWKDLAGMRDKLIHIYFGVNLEKVWEAVNEEIPPLKPLFEKILKDLGR